MRDGSLDMISVELNKKIIENGRNKENQVYSRLPDIITMFLVKRIKQKSIKS